MNRIISISMCFLLAVGAWSSAAQGSPAPPENKLETRYAVNIIDDATFFTNEYPGLPSVLNRFLSEPSFSMRFQNRYTFSTSVIGITKTYNDTATQLLEREAYVGFSQGDFDLTAGRKLVRWGTGYAFTVAGVLDPPRIPTDPSDRLNLNEGRDMVKADWVHGRHAFTFAWSTAALARAGTKLCDTSAFRYNVLLHGFDTSLIAGHDLSDSFGGLTFTRVIGQAWEAHGEFMWREHQAILIGGKYTMRNGVTFLGEFYTPPDIPYFRDAAVSTTAGRQHYAFLNASKSRLRDRPGWKEWDVSGAIVSNLDDRSSAGVFDISRWFGKHLSAYGHADIPFGDKHSDYGAALYSSATSLGVRFQL